MEIGHRVDPGGPRRRRPRRVIRAAVIVSLAGCLGLGGLWAWQWWRQPAGPPPAPGPGALARTAVTAGVPAALPDLVVLIGEQEARLRTHPRDARAWAVLGAAYVERGRRLADATFYPTAERALRTSLKVRPRANASALEGLAALANARRDFPAARTWAEAARKADGTRWTTYPQLIDAYTGLGDHKAVERTLDRLMELRSGAAVRARAGAVYRDKGWREDATAALWEAAAQAEQPAERAAWLERCGQLAFERGDREVALRYFREALRVDPAQWAARAGQARALAALGRTSEALSGYRAALAGQPSPEYALELGELYESLGLAQDARAQYDLLRAQVRNAAADGVDGALPLGRLEADHGDPGEAVRGLRAQFRRQPSTAVADALAWALHRAAVAGVTDVADGDVVEAEKEALRLAVRATESKHGGGVRSALYAYHRGMIEKSLGREGPARRHLDEALQINPYFSPLHAPKARAALTALGKPSVTEMPEGVTPGVPAGASVGEVAGGGAGQWG
ncbi:tetratricopeptide repeat protein [Streptomyces sp. NPDC088789]|uniref:tetratricopeptide repeat protein n=1 Tax=Streptomyces sp. NPDC088789 TaxID=3365899 RepID=UPI0038184BFF